MPASTVSLVQQLKLFKEMQAYYSRHVISFTGAPVETPIISQPPTAFPPAPQIPRS
jgi:hypothetical protein